LAELGFVRHPKQGVGGHQYKYYHPIRAMVCQNNRPFVIVSSKIYPVIVKNIIKKVQYCYSFSEEEIQSALDRL